MDTLDRQLSQARAQFEHYQEATAARRAEERQGYERRIGRLEQDLTGAQRHVAAQQATIGQQEATIGHLTAEQERSAQTLRAKLAGKARENEMLGEQLRRAEERASQLAEEKAAWLQERGALEQRVQAAVRQANDGSGSTTPP